MWIVLLIIPLLVALLYDAKQKQEKEAEAKAEYEDKMRRVNLNQIDRMEGLEFEQWCGWMLRKQGFSALVTKASGDQGADVIAEKDGHRYAVQCKRYWDKVGNKAVQEVVAAKKYYRCDRACVITNSRFTDGAKELAAANQVLLIDRDRLLHMGPDWNQYLIEQKPPQKIRIPKAEAPKPQGTIPPVAVKVAPDTDYQSLLDAEIQKNKDLAAELENEKRRNAEMRAAYNDVYVQKNHFQIASERLKNENSTLKSVNERLQSETQTLKNRFRSAETEIKLKELRLKVEMGVITEDDFIQEQERILH